MVQWSNALGWGKLLEKRASRESSEILEYFELDAKIIIWSKILIFPY